MRPVILSRTLVAAAVGAIAASQTTAGAGNLLINGTLAANGVATLDTQRTVGLTSGGNLSAVNFTLTGTDSQGRVISEVLAGPSGNTVSSVLNYKTVTSIAVSAAVASAVTADTVATGASQEIPVDRYLGPTDISIGVVITGTLNYTVQWTLDNVFGGPGPFTWFSAAANLVGASSTQAGSIGAPVSAIRLLTNSGAGTGVITVQQSGMLS